MSLQHSKHHPLHLAMREPMRPQLGLYESSLFDLALIQPRVRSVRLPVQVVWLALGPLSGVA